MPSGSMKWRPRRWVSRPIAGRAPLHEPVVRGLGDRVRDGTARVELPAEQVAVVAPEPLRVRSDDLAVDHWLSHASFLSSPKVLAMFVYLSSGSQVYTPAQLRGWLSEAGFTAPRRVSILRIPGQAMYVAKKTG